LACFHLYPSPILYRPRISIDLSGGGKENPEKLRGSYEYIPVRSAAMRRRM
jgi:hypothetical protein